MALLAAGLAGAHAEPLCDSRAGTKQCACARRLAWPAQHAVLHPPVHLCLRMLPFITPQYGEDNTTVPWMGGIYVPPGDSTTSEEEGIPVRLRWSLTQKLHLPSSSVQVAPCVGASTHQTAAWDASHPAAKASWLDATARLQCLIHSAANCLPMLRAGQDPRPEPPPPSGHRSQQLRRLEGVFVWCAEGSCCVDRRAAAAALHRAEWRMGSACAHCMCIGVAVQDVHSVMQSSALGPAQPAHSMRCAPMLACLALLSRAQAGLPGRRPAGQHKCQDG